MSGNTARPDDAASGPTSAPGSDGNGKSKANGQHFEPDEGLADDEFTSGPDGAAGSGEDADADTGAGTADDAWRADLPTEASVKADPLSVYGPAARRALGYLYRQDLEAFLRFKPEIVTWAGGHPDITAPKLEDHVRKAATALRVEERAVSAEDDEKIGAADLLIALAKSDYEFCYSPGGMTYATKAGSGYAMRVRGEALALALIDSYETNHGRALPPDALRTALHSLNAFARVRGRRRRVFARVAAVKDRIYYDLGNDKDEFTEVGPAAQVNGAWQPSWRIVSGAPVLFTRAADFGQLPYPVAGGSIDELKPFLALRDEHSFKMAVGFVLGSMTTRGPRPGAAMGGVHGGGKTTRTRFLCGLVDPLPPNVGDDDDPADTAPPEPDGPQDEPWDLLITAQDHWMLTRDNVSEITDRWADTMCRLSTGGRMRRRTFYGLLDETSLSAIRPMIVTATRDLIVRPDLADRYVFIIGGDIPDAERRTEADLWAAFLRAQPRILGCLLDAVSVGLANTNLSVPEKKPRMLDFLIWVSRCEEGLGWPPGTFQAAYAQNVAVGTEAVADASPLVSAVRDFMDSSPPFEDLLDPPADVMEGWDGWTRAGWGGTASVLLDALDALVRQPTRSRKDWPKDARRLGTLLPESSVTLGRLGITVTKAQRQKQRRCILLLRPAVDPATVTPATATGAANDTSSTPAAATSDQAANDTSSTVPVSPKTKARAKAAPDQAKATVTPDQAKAKLARVRRHFPGSAA